MYEGGYHTSSFSYMSIIMTPDAAVGSLMAALRQYSQSVMGRVGAVLGSC